MRSGEGLLILFLGTPVDEIARVQGNAKEIGGHEAELGRTDADHTDDSTIDGSNNPALPELLAEEDGAQDGQNAREIIESNHVENSQHVGLMGRCRSLPKQFTCALGFRFSFITDSLLYPALTDCHRALGGTLSRGHAEKGLPSVARGSNSEAIHVGPPPDAIN